MYPFSSENSSILLPSVVTLTSNPGVSFRSTRAGYPPPFSDKTTDWQWRRMSGGSSSGWPKAQASPVNNGVFPEPFFPSRTVDPAPKSSLPDVQPLEPRGMNSMEESGELMTVAVHGVRRPGRNVPGCGKIRPFHLPDAAVFAQTHSLCRYTGHFYLDLA